MLTFSLRDSFGLTSLLQETVLRKLNVSYMSRDNAKMAKMADHRRTKPERSWETSQKQSRVNARSLLTAGTPQDPQTTRRDGPSPEIKV